MGQLEYLTALFLCLVVTLPLELVLHVGVYRQARRLLASLSCAGVAFVTWDLVGARLGHWGYNPAYVTGLEVVGLPIEEYLFFIVVPLCGILAYEAVRATLPDVSRWLADRWERVREAMRR
ncbi:MAG: lycopene cyclase domain-containing protein [Egibacteraceae bacterium]